MLTLSQTKPDNAVDRHYAGVILLLPDQRVVLQRRDKHAHIVNPGLVSLFGGVVEKGRAFVEAAVRELREELELRITETALEPLGYVIKTESDSTLTLCHVFVLGLQSLQHLVQHEGTGMYVDHIERAAIHPLATEVLRVSLQVCNAKYQPKLSE